MRARRYARNAAVERKVERAPIFIRPPRATPRRLRPPARWQQYALRSARAVTTARLRRAPPRRLRAPNGTLLLARNIRHVSRCRLPPYVMLL